MKPLKERIQIKLQEAYKDLERLDEQRALVKAQIAMCEQFLEMKAKGKRQKV